jgi:mannosyltransferase OCH1-like enzyme
MVPKIIHHVWIDPRDQPDYKSTIPPEIQDNLLSWRTLEVGYRQTVWQLPDILDICKNQKKTRIVQALQSCRFPSMQADIARLMLLWIFGGFWVDLKLHLNRRFLDRLADNDLILTEHFPKIDLPSPDGRLSSSFIGAVPGNLVIAKALASAVRNVNHRMRGSIYHVTGATNLEAALLNTKNPGKYLMLSHQTAWDYLFTIRGGSYNGENMHWSLREQRESPYHD